jgi:hypothetical protein
MKRSANLLLSGISLALPGIVHGQLELADPDLDARDPFIPIGFLSVTPTVVQPGVQPEMTWEIEYPSSIPDIVVIDGADGMTTLNDKTDKVNIRVAGVSFESGGTDLPVALWVSVDGGGWNLAFYGTESQVDAGSVVFTQNISPGSTINLAVRGGNSTNGWTETVWTLAPSPNVEALIDGDPLPTDSSAFTTGDPESFMTQFIDANNEVVAGPRDVIHVFEVGSTNPGDSYFDMQDIVVVTTFGKTNNGHGNNEDGFDSSNMGSSTGVGGVDDSSWDADKEMWIDDEKEKIKRK